jgi:hypothetical protein
VGLQTNFAKYSVSPIGCTEEVVLEADLVIKYLGIPLSSRWLIVASLQPLVEKIVDKLPTWKAGMKAKAVRLTFVGSFLTDIPLHQLVVLGVSKKSLK